VALLRKDICTQNKALLNRFNVHSRDHRDSPCRDTGLRKYIWCLKLRVSFRKRAANNNIRLFWMDLMFRVDFIDIVRVRIRGGKSASDALSCMSLSAKEPLIIGLFYRKWPVKPYNDTGWRKCIGCLSLQACFRKRATNYKTFLRKMTYTAV